MEPADRRNQRGVEADLLEGLTQGRTDRVLALVEAPAREADLALVCPQTGGAPGEDQARLAFLLEERYQHARVDVLGHRGLSHHRCLEDPVPAHVGRYRTGLARRFECAERMTESDGRPPRR